MLYFVYNMALWYSPGCLWYSVCSLLWPETHNSPFSTFWGLGVQMFTATDGLNRKHLRRTICMSGHVCIPVSTERPLASSATTATTNAPSAQDPAFPQTPCLWVEATSFCHEVTPYSWACSLSVCRIQGSFGEHLEESQVILFPGLPFHAFTHVASLSVLGQECTMGHCTAQEGSRE